MTEGQVWEEATELPPTSTSWMTIEDLPNELLLTVLQSIDRNNVSNATLVSKKWYTIVNEMIGRRLFVGRKCQIVPQDNRYQRTYVDISEISKIGVYECYIGEVVDPSRRMTLWARLFSKLKKALFYENGDPGFKYPYLIKTLHFDGPIPASYFDSVLNNTVNLSRLELHMTAFCNVNNSNLINLGLKWKNLKELSIWGHKLTDGFFTEFFDPQNIIPNLIILMSNTFQALEYFAFEYPFDIRDDRQLSRDILSFLTRHQKLTNLRICINMPISEDSSTFESFEDRDWIKEAKVASKMLHLNNFELIVSSMRKVRLTKVWMSFLENQRNLENITILSFRVPPHLLMSICQHNKIRLKRLFVSRILMSNVNQPNLPVQLDAAMFTSCSTLTHLTVEGMLHNTTTAGLLSTKLLPKTLVNLEIGGILLLHKDAHDVFFELPNLHRICFTDIGNRGQFGLTIDSLVQIILQRKVDVVNLYRCICGDFPATGIHNGDPSHNRKFIRVRPYEILEMKLNSEKYYENAHKESLSLEEFNDE